MTMPDIADVSVDEPIIAAGDTESPRSGEQAAEPVFLSSEQVIHINQRLAEASGQAHELLQADLLSSALARVRVLWDSGERDVAALAGHLLLGIGISEPFRSANERTALTAAKVFLNFNGYSLVAPDAEPLTLLIERAISGVIPEDIFLRAIRASAIPTEQWRAYQDSQA